MDSFLHQEVERIVATVNLLSQTGGTHNKKYYIHEAQGALAIEHLIDVLKVELCLNPTWEYKLTLLEHKPGDTLLFKVEWLPKINATYLVKNTGPVPLIKYAIALLDELSFPSPFQTKQLGALIEAIDTSGNHARDRQDLAKAIIVGILKDYIKGYRLHESDPELARWMKKHA